MARGDRENNRQNKRKNEEDRTEKKRALRIHERMGKNSEESLERLPFR